MGWVAPSVCELTSKSRLLVCADTWNPTRPADVVARGNEALLGATPPCASDRQQSIDWVKLLSAREMGPLGDWVANPFKQMGGWGNLDELNPGAACLGALDRTFYFSTSRIEIKIVLLDTKKRRELNRSKVPSRLRRGDESPV